MAFIAWVGGAARADDTHYQDFVVGGRSMGMGGAFAALADDPAGIFYNPAGIADVQRTNLQVNTSLYGFERGAIEDRRILPVSGVGSLSLDFTDLIVVPASAGFLTTFGAKDTEGHSRQTYGLSVLVPSYRSYSATAGDTQRSYLRRVTDRELWTGLGYGRKLGDRLRIGVSGYYVLRSVADREEVTLHAVLADGAQRFQTLTNDVSVLAGSLVLIAGAKYYASSKWTLGASLQAPSIDLHGQSELHSAETLSDPSAPVGQQSAFRNLDILAGAQTKHAGGLRIGVAYQTKHHYTFAADVSGHLPVHYTLATVNPEHRARLPFNPDISRLPVVNLNFGGEVLIVREVSVSAGVFTDFSSAPSIGIAPGSDQPPAVDLLGFTMALGYFGEYTLSRLGVVYSFGQGYDVIPNVAQNFQTQAANLRQFSRVQYFQSFFYVFISSSFRY